MQQLGGQRRRATLVNHIRSGQFSLEVIRQVAAIEIAQTDLVCSSMVERIRKGKIEAFRFPSVRFSQVVINARNYTVIRVSEQH